MLKFFSFNQRKIRVRLTFWYVLLLACTLILFSGYLYLQLKYSLLDQLNTALEVTASEITSNAIEKDNHPAFDRTIQFEANVNHLTHVGFAVRLIDDHGQVWDGFGNYQALPFYLPTQPGYETLTSKNTIWRIYNQPLAIKTDRGTSWLQVAQSLKSVYKASEKLLRLMLFGFPLVLLLASLGGLFLADRALRPIDRIIRTTQSIKSNNFTQRIGYQGPPDEVGRLANTLDRMLDRIQLGLENERRFISDASHELRTPLTVIKGRIGVTLGRTRTPEEYQKTLQDLEQEADRLIRLSNGLLFLARLEQEELHSLWQSSEVDLSNLLLVLVEQMDFLATTKQISLQEQIAPELIVRGNADYLTNLFLNLLDNAIKYTPDRGLVKVETDKNQGQIEIKITNTGNGIAEEHLPHLFKRFYRAESARSRSTGGAGLGLAIAYEIARLHGGLIAVQSSIGLSTTFTVYLPRVFQ